MYNEMVKAIWSPLKTIGEMAQDNRDIAKMVSTCKNAHMFDLNKMYPKVSYNYSFVCKYGVDDKLYLVNEDEIIEVEAIAMLPLDNGMTDEELFEYCDNDFCGMTDDFRHYAYFKYI